MKLLGGRLRFANVRVWLLQDPGKALLALSKLDQVNRYSVT